MACFVLVTFVIASFKELSGLYEKCEHPIMSLDGVSVNIELDAIANNACAMFWTFHHPNVFKNAVAKTSVDCVYT